MNNFLVVALFAALGIAVYEYYLHDQQAATYVQQRADLTSRIVKLKKENKDLADEGDALTQKLTDLQKQAADLTAQVDASHGTPLAPAATNSPPASP